MSIKDTVQSLLGGSNDLEDEVEAAPEESPSHVCQSCGEEYFSDPEMEIDTCRSCGGIKVERV
ncbi:UspA domain-containing protein [Salinarchaeum sp. Harcht-Bsk1]|nr:UspA domain-containing protein [Salinarchaeum sp. Harcht-Bsk1]